MQSVKLYASPFPLGEGVTWCGNGRKRWRCCKPSLAVFALGLICCTASGADFDLNGWKGNLSLIGTSGFGIRTRSADPRLVPIADGASAGIVGTAKSSGNDDDGEINYKGGDFFSAVIKASTVLDVHQEDNYGFHITSMAWYDYVLENTDVAFGNNPNNYRPNSPLSDAGAPEEARFRGAVVEDAYFYSKASLLGGNFSYRIGQQSLDWGRNLVIPGGLRDLAAQNQPAQNRPGALPQEAVIPFAGASFKWDVTSTLRLEGFYQVQWAMTVNNECGTFMSGNDYSPPGCDRVFYSSSLSNPQAVAKGAYAPRLADIRPSNDRDEFGLAASYLLRPLATRVGVYYAHYDSRIGYPDSVKGTAIGPSGGNAYLLDYPRAKDLVALSTSTQLKSMGLTILSEGSVTFHQPVQLNGSDQLNAFIAGSGPLAAEAAALPKGGILRAYDRYTVIQSEIGILKDFRPMLGASRESFGLEPGLKYTSGFPPINVRRYGRADLFGAAPAAGAPCPPGSSIQSCSESGFDTAFSWGYKARLEFEYDRIFNRDIVIRPAIGFAQDVRGWSYDGGFNQGRMFIRSELNASIGERYFGNVTYGISRGGEFNTKKDRDYVLMSLGVRL